VGILPPQKVGEFEEVIMVPTLSGSNRWVVELRKLHQTITVRTLVARKKKILVGEEKTLQTK